MKVKKWASGVGVLAAVVLAIELGFRALTGPLGIPRQRIADYRTFLRSGQSPHFKPDANMVYRHPRARRSVNEQGFNDRPWSLTREPGEFRVLCLGASTTEGGNAGGPEGAFPRQLEHELERRTGRPHLVMNAGMSGWTTNEMLVAWFLLLRDYAPDVLVLHEGGNDLMPRFIPNFRPDYSHWRRSMPTCGVHGLARWLTVSELYLYLRLRASGVPNIMDLTGSGRSRPFEGERLPPETAFPFARNMASIARDARTLPARVVFMTMPHKQDYDGPMAPYWMRGILENDEQVRELARREGYGLVDAAQVFRERDAELGATLLDLVHLTPEGNQVKAELLADWILAQPPLPR